MQEVAGKDELQLWEEKKELPRTTEVEVNQKGPAPLHFPDIHM